MMVAYTGGRRPASLQLPAAPVADYAEPLCQSLAGRAVDELVGRQVLAALEPAALEVSLAAGERGRAGAERLARHWQQRLERARYEAERAARQYQACEPENRLVARELERRWEEALDEQRQVEDEYDRCAAERPAAADRRRAGPIQALAADLPALWRAADDHGRGPPGDRPAPGRAGRRHGPGRDRVGGRERSTGPAGSSAGTRSSARCGGTTSCATTRLLAGSSSCGRPTGPRRRSPSAEPGGVPPAEGPRDVHGRDGPTTALAAGLERTRPRREGERRAARAGEWWLSDLAASWACPSRLGPLPGPRAGSVAEVAGRPGPLGALGGCCGPRPASPPPGSPGMAGRAPAPS